MCVAVASLGILCPGASGHQHFTFGVRPAAERNLVEYVYAVDRASQACIVTLGVKGLKCDITSSSVFPGTFIL